MAHICTYDERRLRRRQDFYLDAPRRWPQGFAFRWQLTGTIQGFTMEEMNSAIDRAFQKWTQTTQMFTFQRASGYDANVTINVAGPNDVDNQNFPVRGGGGYILAVGQMGPHGQGNNLTGSITFNNTRTGLPKWNIAAIHNVMVHEFGHVLGLGHVRAQPQALMSPMIPNMNNEIPLQPPDVEKFSTFYGLSYNNNGNDQGQYNNQQPQQPQQPVQPQNNYPQQPQQPQNNYYNQPQQPQNNYNQPGQPENSAPRQGNRQICDDQHTQCYSRRRVKRGMAMAEVIRRNADKAGKKKVGKRQDEQQTDQSMVLEYNPNMYDADGRIKVDAVAGAMRLKSRQDNYGDRCRPQWEQCMREQGLMK